MSRRFRFFSILFTAAVGTCLAAFGGWYYARASAPVNGPVILISIDALRPDRLSAYGDRDARTPAIDALARDGILFEHAYTHAAETLPAHVTMLSGRLPFETGVRGDDGHVNSTERLLARMVHERGYATAGIVSSTTLGRDTGFADGFDFFDAPREPDSGPGPLPSRRPGAESEKIAEHWLDLQSSSRAFLFLHLDDVHRPYPAVEDADDSQRYDTQVSKADEAVGLLVRWLKAHQLYDRTTIVVTADHGEGLGDHGEQAHGVFAYDDTIRVPLIVKQAGTNAGGRRVATPVQLIDLAPTLLDLVKAPIAGNLRGQSLKTILDGGTLQPPAAIYAEARYGRRMFGWAPLATTTDGKWRYIAAPREELYNLATDPREQQNVIESRAADATRLRDALKALTAGVKGIDPLHPAPDAADPKDVWPVAERYRANLALRSERPLDALAGFRAMTADDPDLSAAWRQIAELSAQAGRLTDASAAYARLVELEPGDPGAHLGAAAIALKTQDAASAADEASRALALAKERPRIGFAAELTLVEAALEQGDGDTAGAHAAAAQKIDPSARVAAYVEGRLLYDSGDYTAAAEAFTRATTGARTAKSRIPDLYYYAGDTLVRLDRSDEAETAFNEELRAFPQNTRARLALASLYHATGRDDEAAATLADALRLAPALDTYSQVAKAWASFGNRKQAEAVRAEGRKAFPGEKRGTR